MYKKSIIIFILLILLTGCMRIEADDTDYVSIVNNVISSGKKDYNRTSIGYEYYLPRGIRLIMDRDYNQIYKYEDVYMYLYVDIVSYYYKNNDNLAFLDNDYYYYNKFDDNGYIMIDKKDNDKYYLKMVYNYAKVEAYCDEINLNKIIAYSSVLLNSISFNDNTIESVLKDSDATTSEKNYVVEGPNTDDEFSQYLKEYKVDSDEEEENSLPDE